MHLKRVTLWPPSVEDVVKREFWSNEESLLRRIGGERYIDGLTFNPEMDGVPLVKGTINFCVGVLKDCDRTGNVSNR